MHFWKMYVSKYYHDVIASNRQVASIIDFTQGEKHSIPVRRESLNSRVENFQQLNIFISPPNYKIISYRALHWYIYNTFVYIVMVT